MSCDCLPTVSVEIGYSLAENILRRNATTDAENMIEEELNHIAEINPAVAVWINEYAGRTSDPEGARWCGAIVYRMLESQAEADRMLKELALE